MRLTNDQVFTTVVLGCGLAVASPAQTAPKLEFDVASVKQNVLPDSRPYSNFPLGPGAMYSPNGGVFSARKLPASIYIMFAYKMTDHELLSLEKQLPAWANDEQFDIEAKTDDHNATKNDMRLMMQSLLADRFKLALHKATEEAPVYALVLARPGKMGPKLRLHPADDTSCSNDLPSAAAAHDAAPAAKPPTTVDGGFPVICGGLAAVPASVPGRLAAGYRNVPLSLIALQLTLMGGLDRPVVDQTGLTDKVDFLIEFTPEGPPGAPSAPELDTSGPSFRQALLEQTGLKLVPQKGPVGVIVIDHIERPSEN